ncbi:copper-binding protein [Photobacterium japonica]|uniref:copper-binding protein n=1 Tax=Photobacterium japonica TaxID=2910235 RepID=UPI003D0AE1DE
MIMHLTKPTFIKPCLTALLPFAYVLLSSSASAMENHDHHAMSAKKMDHAQMDHSQMGHGEMASTVGMPAPTAQAKHTYQVTLSDDMRMQFSPALSIQQGDVVRFVITNTGKEPHSFSIGSVNEQQAHRKMMANMKMVHHNNDTTITLPPGESAEMGWHFMGDKFVEFTCHENGHAKAGMKRNTVLR